MVPSVPGMLKAPSTASQRGPVHRQVGQLRGRYRMPRLLPSLGSNVGQSPLPPHRNPVTMMVLQAGLKYVPPGLYSGTKTKRTQKAAKNKPSL